MRLQLFTYVGFAALTLGLTSACEGGQTGDLSGEHPEGGTTDSFGGCEEHKQKLASFQTMTDNGSPEQVLAYAERSFEAPIAWKEAPEGQAWQLGPESGTGALHLDVTRGDEAYLLTYSPPESQDGGAHTDIGILCPPSQLGVEVHVNVTTDGGALAESYDTLLRTSAPGIAGVSVPFDVSKLGGSLTVSFSQPRTKLVQLSLNATLMPEGMAGSISGMQQIDSGSGPGAASSANGAVLAVWPGSAACQALAGDGGGLSVTVEQSALGVSGSDTLASVALAEPKSITWLDGTTSMLTVDIEATGDGCLRVRNDIPAEFGGGAGVNYPVTIRAKSEDGRLDGSYTGQVIVSGSGSQRSVTAEAWLDLEVDDVAQSGFTGVTVPSGSDGLRLQFTSSFAPGDTTGIVRLVSVSDPPCLTNPEPPMSTPGGGASAPGCAGQAQTPLEVASWAN